MKQLDPDKLIVEIKKLQIEQLRGIRDAFREGQWATLNQIEKLILSLSTEQEALPETEITEKNFEEIVRNHIGSLEEYHDISNCTQELYSLAQTHAKQLLVNQEEKTSFAEIEWQKYKNELRILKTQKQEGVVLPSELISDLQMKSIKFIQNYFNDELSLTKGSVVRRKNESYMLDTSDFIFAKLKRLKPSSVSTENQEETISIEQIKTKDEILDMVAKKYGAKDFHYMEVNHSIFHKGSFIGINVMFREAMELYANQFKNH